MKKVISYVVMAICLIAIGFGLSVEPSTFIQTSQSGWLIPRVVALILSVALGVTTYYSADLGATLRGLKDDIINLRADKKASNSVSEFLNNISVLAWTAWWAITFQVMVSFYIADWCKFGF